MTELQATEIIGLLKSMRVILYFIESAAFLGATSLFFIMGRGK